METACDSLRGVIAFLNGADLEESLFSFGVLVAKMVGVICACGSSLAVGPEGPMIHIGATIGLPRNAEIVPNCSKLQPLHEASVDFLEKCPFDRDAVRQEIPGSMGKSSTRMEGMFFIYNIYVYIYIYPHMYV